MKELAPTIFDFMIDKNTATRKFLVKFAADAMNDKDHMQLIFPSFLNLLNFLVQDVSDSILILIVKEFRKYYEKMIMAIVTMQPQPGKSQGKLLGYGLG